MRTALDRAAAQNIQGKFDKQPEVEAAIRDTIGQTYHDLGLYPEARKQLERALELQRRVLGAENPKTLRDDEPPGQRLSTSRASTRRLRRSSARPWRSSAASWVPSIPTRCIP